MSFQFLPLYTGDYLRDTRHLTPMRHGAYLLLLMHCWDQKGPLPLDEQECAGIANCRSADEIEALRYILNRYFIRMDDGWYNTRIQGEIERAEAISAKRKYAGSLGYQAKAKHLKSKSSARASTPTPTPTPTPTTTTTPKKTSGPSAADFASVIEFLNARCGRSFPPKGVNTEFVEARINEGATIEQCMAVIERKAQQWKGTDMEIYLRPATLFNRRNFAQYVGEDGLVVKPVGERSLPWHTSEATVRAKAKELGLSDRPGEEWAAFKERIAAKIKERA